MKDVLHYVDLDTQPYWEEFFAALGLRQLEAWLRPYQEFALYVEMQERPEGRS